jgi:serine/threonine protein kinase
MRIDKPLIEKVGPDSFEFVQIVGKGSFGEVHKVMHKRTKELFAMKVQHKKRVVRENILRFAQTERNVLCFMRHPYIVALHYAFQTPGYLVLVLKFAPGGNLQDLIEKEKRLQEPLARLYSAEVLLGIIYLHERKIIYRDMKPENVVLDEDRHALLTDFGLSKEGAITDDNRTFCGSIAYLAPEILKRQGHGRTVDVYGLGTLLFAMLTGWPPFFHKDKEILFSNIKHARLRFPENMVPPFARALISGLMERDPSKRIGAAHTADVKDEDFFICIDFELLMERKIPVPELPSTVVEPKVTATKPQNSKDPFSEPAKQKAGVSEFVANWSWQSPE